MASSDHGNCGSLASTTLPRRPPRAAGMTAPAPAAISTRGGGRLRLFVVLAGLYLAQAIPSYLLVAAIPPIITPIVAWVNASIPSVIRKVIEIAVVSTNSAVLTVPIVMRGLAP